LTQIIGTALEKLDSVLKYSTGGKREKIIAEMEKCGAVNTIKSLQHRSSLEYYARRGLPQRIPQKLFSNAPQVEEITSGHNTK